MADKPKTLPVKTEIEQSPMETDIFQEGKEPEENFEILVTSISELNHQAGMRVVESRWYMGKLVHIYDEDRKNGGKIFGTYKLQDVGARVGIKCLTLDRWHKLYETWNLDEIQEMMTKGISKSHFENLIGLATPEDRREAVKKLMLPDGNVVPVNEMAEVIPSARETKERAGIKDGRGRPSKKDKEKKKKEQTTEDDGPQDPCLFFVSVGEKASELRSLLSLSAKTMKLAEGQYDDKQMKELKKVLKATAKKVESLSRTIEKVYAKPE